MKKFVVIGIILLFTSCTRAPIGVSPTLIPTNFYISTATSYPTIAITAATSHNAQSSVPNKSKKYVGLNYPPLSQGLSEGFAVIIWDSDDYLFSLVEDEHQKMFWLSKMSHRDSAGKHQWIVKDTLTAPILGENEMFYANGCLLNGDYDFEIIAAGKWDNDVYVSRFVPHNKIFRAWRVDLEKEMFEEIDIAGIECSAEYQFR
jgi:hypothetical protein